MRATLFNLRHEKGRQWQDSDIFLDKFIFTTDAEALPSFKSGASMLEDRIGESNSQLGTDPPRRT